MYAREAEKTKGKKMRLSTSHYVDYQIVVRFA